MNVETFITIGGLLKNDFFDVTFILCRHSLYISQASFFFFIIEGFLETIVVYQLTF